MQFHTPRVVLALYSPIFLRRLNAAYSASAVSAVSSAAGFFLPNLALSRPMIVGISDSTRIAKEHSQRTPLLNHFLGLFDAFRSHGLDFAGFDDATSEEVADPVVALVADDRGAPDHR